MNNERNDHAAFLTIVTFLLIFLGIPALYAAKADVINGFLLAICKAELRLFVPFSQTAAKGLTKISEFNPASLNWENMSTILYFTGQYIRWPFLFILILLGISSHFLSRTKELTRKFSMATLLKNNAEIFPCLTPVVGRGDYLLSRESYDSGNWTIARSPLQFAAQHNLLLSSNNLPFASDQILHEGLGSKEMPAWSNAHFDEVTAEKIFTEQLGKFVQNFEEMTPVRQVIATAFALHATGKKKKGIKLLDSLSISYHEDEKTPPECTQLKNASFMNKVKKYWLSMPQIENLSDKHAFELTWFMELLTLARKKGLLAPAQFLFLKPIDRPLWYALNQCGGRTAWTEGAAAWSHYQAEKMAKKAITEPQIAGAIFGLKKELDNQGWLAEDTAADAAHEAYLKSLENQAI